MDLSKMYLVRQKLVTSLNLMENSLNDLAEESLRGIKPYEFSEDKSYMETAQELTNKLNEVIRVMNELTEKSRT